LNLTTEKQYAYGKFVASFKKSMYPIQAIQSLSMVDDERSAAVHASMRLAVAQIAHASAKRERVTISSTLVDYVTELAEGFADRLMFDMCSFAKHAKRNTVSTDDVRLCARNNEAMMDALNAFERDNQTTGAADTDGI